MFKKIISKIKYNYSLLDDRDFAFLNFDFVYDLIKYTFIFFVIFFFVEILALHLSNIIIQVADPVKLQNYLQTTNY